MLIVQPSCNPLVAGSDVLREERLSPWLKGSLEDFEVFVVEDKVRYFGKVGEVRKL